MRLRRYRPRRWRPPVRGLVGALFGDQRLDDHLMRFELRAVLTALFHVHAHGLVSPAVLPRVRQAFAASAGLLVASRGRSSAGRAGLLRAAEMAATSETGAALQPTTKATAESVAARMLDAILR